VLSHNTSELSNTYLWTPSHRHHWRYYDCPGISLHTACHYQTGTGWYETLTYRLNDISRPAWHRPKQGSECHSQRSGMDDICTVLAFECKQTTGASMTQGKWALLWVPIIGVTRAGASFAKTWEALYTNPIMRRPDFSFPADPDLAKVTSCHVLVCTTFYPSVCL